MVMDQRRRGIENAWILTAERLQRAKQGICCVHLRPWDPATSYRRPRFAGPQADYLEVSHPRLKTHCCRHEEPTVIPSEKRNGIPAQSCWSQPAESRDLSLLREAHAAEAPRVAWIGTDDELPLAASDNAETRSAVSASFNRRFIKQMKIGVSPVEKHALVNELHRFITMKANYKSQKRRINKTSTFPI